MKNWRYKICMALLCGFFAVAAPTETQAAPTGPGLENGNFAATVEAEALPIYVSMDSYDVIRDAQPGEVYRVTGVEENNWIEIAVDGGVGYISLSGVSLEDVDELAAEDQQMLENQETAVLAADERRQNLVNFALQFVGGRYRYGGSDPHTGVDCSGFTRYVLQHGAGVSVSRSSGSQVNDGARIGADQMRPGDLVFYGNGSRINHVAMYIGNGQVVHASTYKTGVKISPWNYRAPIAIVNTLGD